MAVSMMSLLSAPMVPEPENPRCCRSFALIKRLKNFSNLRVLELVVHMPTHSTRIHVSAPTQSSEMARYPRLRYSAQDLNELPYALLPFKERPQYLEAGRVPQVVEEFGIGG
jgi:hypothetical protein